MLLILSLGSMMISFSSKHLTHPVSFMITILAQTITICFISIIFLPSPWYGFVLFLIFIGGVMVLFVYMASLASNENFLWDPMESMTASIILFTAIPLFIFKFSPFLIYLNNNMSYFVYSLYSLTFSPFMMFLILYLLFTLVVVCSLVKKNKSPMRSMK